MANPPTDTEFYVMIGEIRATVKSIDGMIRTLTKQQETSEREHKQQIEELRRDIREVASRVSVIETTAKNAKWFASAIGGALAVVAGLVLKAFGVNV